MAGLTDGLIEIRHSGSSTYRILVRRPGRGATEPRSITFEECPEVDIRSVTELTDVTLNLRHTESNSTFGASTNGSGRIKGVTMSEPAISLETDDTEGHGRRIPPAPMVDAGESDTEGHGGRRISGAPTVDAGESDAEGHGGRRPGAPTVDAAETDTEGHGKRIPPAPAVDVGETDVEGHGKRPPGAAS